MKNLYFALILMFSFSINSFGHNDLDNQQPKVGDTLIIAQPKGETYKHIDFPRLNTLVKRGKIASYKSVYNVEVIVTKVMENEYGRVDAKLERVDGKKFFNLSKSVTSNYSKAIEIGELRTKS